jgi:hypothetical protein
MAESVLNEERAYDAYTDARTDRFVRAQIFGTTFEITSRCEQTPLRCLAKLTRRRYTDLQPVGMGAFGLVWYGLRASGDAGY